MKHQPTGNKYKSKTSFEDNISHDLDNQTSIDTRSKNIQEHITTTDIMHRLFRTALVTNVSFIISLFALSIGMDGIRRKSHFPLPWFPWRIEYSVRTYGFCDCLLWNPFVSLCTRCPKISRTGKYVPMRLFCIHGLCYRILVHPYLMLILEPLHGITIACAMTTSVSFADEWVPSGYEASVQGFMSMMRGLG